MYIIIIETLNSNGDIIDWISYDKDGVISNNKEKYNTFKTSEEINKWVKSNNKITHHNKIVLYELLEKTIMYY